MGATSYHKLNMFLIASDYNLPQFNAETSTVKK